MTGDRDRAPPEDGGPGADGPGNAPDRLDDDPDGGDAFRVYELDPDEAPSTGVVMAVAAVTGEPAGSLEPLGATVDTDALDRLVDPAGHTPVSVTFTYAGTTVTVDSTRRVLLHR